MQGYPFGFHHYFYSKDTLNGRIFQQVKGEELLKTQNTNNIYVLGDTTALVTYHFLTSNDTVYGLSTTNTLQFLWFNNPNVGDIWKFGPQYDWNSNTYIKAYSQVDSIKFVTINGEQLKEIYSHSAKDSIGTPVQYLDTALFVNYIWKINTKFGPIYGFNGIGTFVTARITDGFTEDELICFQSDSFAFYQANIR